MLQQVSEKFTGAVDLTWKPLHTPAAAVRVYVHYNQAPATTGAVQVIRKSRFGTDFDTVVEQDDPSTGGGVTDQTFLSENLIPLLQGDSVQVVYANPDSRTVGVVIVAEDDYLPSA